MCSLSNYVWLTGDMYARTAVLCYYIVADPLIADFMDFDQSTLNFFNQANSLCSININKERVSQDSKTNTNGYKLIDICRNNNLFILNGRFGKDKRLGKFTFREQSLIDYTLCSFERLKLLIDFEVTETDPIFSDGHSLLTWSFACANSHNPSYTHMEARKDYKTWDQQRASVFSENLPVFEIRDLCHNLKPNSQSINETVTNLANLFINTAKKSFPVKPRNPRHAHDRPWFGGKCRAARNKYHRAKGKFHKTKISEDRTHLISASKEYKRTMNTFIAKHKDSKAKQLRDMHSNRPKDFWKYLNSLKPKENSIMPSVEEFYSNFKNINADPNHTDFDFESSNFNIHDNENILNSSITECEIKTAIKKFEKRQVPRS